MSAPYKRWEAAVEGKPGVSFRGQAAAYEWVSDVVSRYGVPVIVRHWEDGGWRLYERVEPVEFGDDPADVTGGPEHEPYNRLGN